MSGTNTEDERKIKEKEARGNISRGSGRVEQI